MHPASPICSILIANYNNGSYIQACIESIINQTYTNWEIIIVDDASTDMSREVLANYEDHPQIRIQYLPQNSGVGFAKRRCADLAQGDIMGFVDADDCLELEALQIGVEKHLLYPECAIVYTNHFICDQELNIIKTADYVGQIPSGSYSWEAPLPTISNLALFKKKYYLRTKGIQKWMDRAVDKEIYYQLEAQGSVIYIDRPLILYRVHAGNISLGRNRRLAMVYQLAAMGLLWNVYLENKMGKPKFYKSGLSIKAGFLLAILHAAIIKKRGYALLELPKLCRILFS
jgi:glycosyltransferase involved in cell wall biosynthesis